MALTRQTTVAATVRLQLTGLRAGLVFGLQLGALAWGAMTLGLASVATAGYPPWSFLSTDSA